MYKRCHAYQRLFDASSLCALYANESNDEQQGLLTGDARSVNLIVNSPDGSFFVGNDFDGDGTPDSSNNVEKVIIPTPALGVWTILVVGANVPQGPQDFALVVSGGGLQRID
ncbi:MAG: hypothetical protein DCC55_15540 [Chloroflexi bacterium]|nr:MAG: hypothetical protein DCC55_15540 [Chloroflexota bacterium]